MPATKQKRASTFENDATRHDPFELLTFKRLGKPPLRTRSRLLSRHAMKLLNHGELLIELRRKQNGQFITAYAGPTADGLRENAEVFETVEAAAEHIEDYCVQLSKGLSVDVSLQDVGILTAPKLISLIVFTAELSRQFRILAGEALAVWQDLTVVEPMESAKGT